MKARTAEMPRRIERGWNDSGNADRLHDAYGKDLLWCEERHSLLVWSEDRWLYDSFIRAERLAERTLLNAYSEVGQIGDDEKRKAFLKFLNSSLHRSGIANMVHSVKRKVQSVSVTEFDADPLTLNCANGTLDLESGVLRPHRREDRNTKLIPIHFDPNAECRRFLDFLGRIMGVHPDASEQQMERAERLISYLQRACGCAATGRPEKVLFILHGSTGNNGKTTFVEIIRAALGDREYAGQVQIETLMATPKEASASNSINADLADLIGRRFVSSSEVDKGHRLALARIKHLTGLGHIRARLLRENFFDFKPSHKLFLDCNDRPIITDPHDAVWNRVKLIPFEVQIPAADIDPKLGEKLKTELPGILSWIVEGARTYLREGLADIPEVLAATEQYRHESDRLGAFLDERCVFKPDAWVPVSELWSAYLGWSEENGEKYPLRKSAFDERMMRYGCEKKVRDNGRVRAWVGLRFSGLGA